MKRYFVLFFLLFLIISLSHTSLPQFDSPKVLFVKESNNFYNLILKLSKGIAIGFLSNAKVTLFAVSSDGWYITNTHISDRDFVSALKMKVKIDVGMKEKIYESQNLIVHPKLDLLLVKIDYKPKYYFKKFKKPHMFEENWILGFRANSGKSLSPAGYVTIDTKYQEYVRTTARGMAGNSGSPVINRKGEVLGIICLSYIAGDMLFITAPIIEEFIKENLK